jgi:hypothetical protein
MIRYNVMNKKICLTAVISKNKSSLLSIDRLGAIALEELNLKVFRAIFCPKIGRSNY